MYGLEVFGFFQAHKNNWLAMLIACSCAVHACSDNPFPFLLGLVQQIMSQEGNRLCRESWNARDWESSRGII